MGKIHWLFQNYRTFQNGEKKIAIQIVDGDIL